MSRKVVEIPVEVWEFSLQDAEHIAALHRETLRLINENASLKAEVERLRKAGDAMADAAYAHCMCQDCEELRDQWRDAKRGDQP